MKDKQLRIIGIAIKYILLLALVWRAFEVQETNLAVIGAVGVLLIAVLDIAENRERNKRKNSQ